MPPATAIQTRRSTLSRTRVAAPLLLGGCALSAIVVWWTWRALQWPQPFDLGLFYHAGQAAWATGRPETVASWDGMPFLAAVMAIVTRITDVGTATNVLSVLNAAVVVTVIAAVLRRLRPVLAPGWWWVAAFGLVSFGPMLASVWVEQVEVISLALALWGFQQLRRERDGRGATLIGLSVAIKPLVILLPFVMLARARTRRAGAQSIAWVIGLNLAALALFALRAHDLTRLSPYPALQNFVHKSRPSNVWACETQNFAPSSLLCRLAGPHNWTVEHFVVAAAVGLIGVWVIDALRGRSATSWEVFAFTCPLSAMVSPIAWSHYQLLLAPLFVLLLVRFTREGATFGAWAGLAIAFLLASLNWQPYGTSLEAIRGLVSSHVQTQRDLLSADAVAQFAQYVLVITGVLWYTRARESQTPRRAQARP